MIYKNKKFLNYKLFSKSGFVLTELLLVIGIIGLLTALVVNSTTSARTKGKDAAVKSNLSIIRSEAELYYVDSLNGYGNPISDSSDCNTGIFSHPDVFLAILAATKSGAENASTGRRCVIGKNGQTWAISIPLYGRSSSWCLASIGQNNLGIASGGGANEIAYCE